jgi:hypothetical protein
MASFTRRGKAWRVEVRKANPPFYATDTFPTKAEGAVWANKVEGGGMRPSGNIPNKP